MEAPTHEARALQAIQCSPHLWAFLQAARTPAWLQPQAWGRWAITRVTLTTPREYAAIGWTTQTRLHYSSWSDLPPEHGTLVMEDSWVELRKHLPLWLAAHGRVLLTGLGLGCTLRGLLTKPAVTQVDVLEWDADLLRIIGPEFRGDPRVQFIQADARTFAVPPRLTWDYAWHDLFTETGCVMDDAGSSSGVPSLHVLHAELLCRYAEACRVQGAWAFPRAFKRCWPRRLLGSGARTSGLTTTRQQLSIREGGHA